MMVYPAVKKSEDMSNRFDRMYERDGHRERRERDRHRMAANAALDASIARQKGSIALHYITFFNVA